MRSEELRRRIEALGRGGSPGGGGGSIATPPAERASARPAHRATEQLEQVVPGVEVESEGGVFYLIERAAGRLGPDHADVADEYARVFLHGAADGQASSAGEALGRLLRADPRSIVYLDIETMGLACVPVFLVGTLSFTGDDFLIRQYLARDQSEERAMLSAVLGDLEAFSHLVTFNGKSFDMPFVLDRAAYNGLPAELDAFHFDLLHESRRRWRDRLCNCRLQTLECAVVGAPRVGDIPGAEIPQAYIDFVTTGDARRMAVILEHNALDLLTMARLVVWMATGRSIEEGPGYDMVAPEVALVPRALPRRATASPEEVARRIAALSGEPARPSGRALPLEEALPARRVQTPTGDCWRVERLWSEAFADGHDLAGRFRHVFVRGAYEVDLAELEPDLLAAAEADPTRIVFLDLVAAGPPGAPLLLGGTLRFTGSDFLIRQYLASESGEEAALISALADELSTADVLVSFGGRSNDIPCLLRRAEAFDLAVEPPAFHLDLQAASARRWENVLGYVTLAELERSISARFRRRSVPGAQIPAVFDEFFRTGGASALAGLLDDNAMDLVTMAEVLLFMFLDRDIRED